MIYKKTHTDKHAMQDHIDKIVARGGGYKVEGNVLSYGWVEQSKNTKVEGKDFVSLIKEASNKGFSKVKVVFKMAYNEKEHKNLPEKIKNSLRKSKTSIFDIKDETLDIVYLINNPKDVKEMYWTK